MISLIDGLPVTIFRTSNDSSRAIRYMSENILELAGHSRMDFVSKKLSWFDIVYPEDISLINKGVKKAKKSSKM